MDTLVVMFLAIGAFALVLMLVSLVGGHSHLGHVDLGHLHLGHLDLAHVHLGHAHVGAAGQSGGEGGIQLTLPTIAGFVGAFGFGGAVVAALWPGRGGGAVLISCMAGLVAAVPTSWAAGRLMSAAIDMPTDATPTSSDVLGAMGVVTSAIPAGGYGAVRLELAGQQVRYNARSTVPLDPGTAVFVIEVPSPTSVVVEPVPQIR